MPSALRVLSGDYGRAYLLDDFIYLCAAGAAVALVIAHRVPRRALDNGNAALRKAVEDPPASAQGNFHAVRVGYLYQ